jgi:hypothetical protein
MFETQFVTFKSEEAETPFAPQWEYIITEQIINKMNYKTLTSFLLKKEKELTKKYKASGDGFTGLGKNSITSRYKHYNLFSYNNTDLKNLKKFILEAHDKLLKTYNIPLPKELWIQCWFNVMRKGEEIKPHLHGTASDSYLGGHFMVQCDDTRTIFINPQNQINDPMTYSSLNKKGKLTIFQTCIPHYTDKQTNKKERISIAFDLSLKKTSENFIRIR